MSDRIAAIQARLDAATPGPWVIRFATHEDTAQRFVAGNNPANAALIANAPEDLAYLLDAHAKLRSAITTEIHRLCVLCRRGGTPRLTSLGFMHDEAADSDRGRWCNAGSLHSVLADSAYCGAHPGDRT